MSTGAQPKKMTDAGLFASGCFTLLLIGFGIIAYWSVPSAANPSPNSIAATVPTSAITPYWLVPTAANSSSNSITKSVPTSPTQSEPNRLVLNERSKDRVNVLLLGIDRRPGEQCPCRSDAIILSTLDRTTMSAGLITIPRDLYVSIPTVGPNRINTATFYGELKKFPGKGPGLAKATIETNFGRTVQYYVVIDFNGFRRIVDILGGVYVYVPQAINDPTFPNDTYGYRPLRIPAGLVHMNGEMALAYARTRHQDSDFGRSKRQLQILLAIRERALRLDVIPRLPGLVQSFWGLIETDLPPQEIIALAHVAAKVKPENIRTASIDDTMTTEIFARGGEYFLIPNQARISRLFDQMIPLADNRLDPRSGPSQEPASILISNGTSSPRLAERTAQFLLGQGFVNVVFDEADRSDYAKTILISSGENFPTTIDALARVFRISRSEVIAAIDLKGKYHIQVILGKDWVLPPTPQAR